MVSYPVLGALAGKLSALCGVVCKRAASDERVGCSAAGLPASRLCVSPHIKDRALRADLLRALCSAGLSAARRDQGIARPAAKRCSGVTEVSGLRTLPIIQPSRRGACSFESSCIITVTSLFLHPTPEPRNWALPVGSSISADARARQRCWPGVVAPAPACQSRFRSAPFVPVLAARPEGALASWRGTRDTGRCKRTGQQAVSNRTPGTRHAGAQASSG